MPIFRLAKRSLEFPPVEFAEPEGILAIGGDLRPARLLAAYQQGIFPWFSKGEPVMWWSPDPRLVLYPDALRVTDSLRRVIDSGKFRVTFDRDFPAVILGCGEIFRPGQDGTWITPGIVESYTALHKMGHVHSVEVWMNDELVGGLYGLAIGRCFCGESMFARVSNASKVGFVTLVRLLKEKGWHMIDCQVPTNHLKSLGAVEIPRTDFIAQLGQAMKAGQGAADWPMVE